MTERSKYDWPPLSMTIPGAGIVILIAAMTIADIVLPYRESMDFSMKLMPFVVLLFLAFGIGFVMDLAKRR